MRIISKSRNHFHGTHKGGEIEIERESDGRFYIRVRWKDGGYLFDGWARNATTMREAKREAIRGACLDEPKDGSLVFRDKRGKPVATLDTSNL